MAYQHYINAKSADIISNPNLTLNYMEFTHRNIWKDQHLDQVTNKQPPVKVFASCYIMPHCLACTVYCKTITPSCMAPAKSIGGRENERRKNRGAVPVTRRREEERRGVKRRDKGKMRESSLIS
jgi:hypothetical protein